MKWFVFGLALVCIVPWGLWLRRQPAWQQRLWFLIGLLPFIGLDSLDINLISYEHYRGDSRGIEVTIVDLFIWALALALPRTTIPAPYRVARLAYLATMLLSSVTAPSPSFCLFSVWKLVRMYVLLGVLTRACAHHPQVAPTLLRGMAYGTLYEFGLVLHQRYVLHIHQTPGNLSHQNTLGMVLNLILPSVLALLLVKQGGRLAFVVLGAGAISILLTLSRGAMAMFVLGGVLVFALSCMRRLRPRKLVLAACAALFAAMALGRAWDSIIDRFVNAPRESAEIRVRFEAAARLMAYENPLGVGINQFSRVLEHGGYAERVGITGYDASAIVHNIYWLTAAEVGWAGLIAYLMVLLHPLFQALWHGLRARHDVRGDVLIGLGIGLCLLYFQGKLEWALRQTAPSYLFWNVVGLVAALSRAVAARPGRLGKP
jgi:O-antigen ligase